MSSLSNDIAGFFNADLAGVGFSSSDQTSVLSAFSAHTQNSSFPERCCGYYRNNVRTTVRSLEQCQFTANIIIVPGVFLLLTGLVVFLVAVLTHIALNMFKT